MVRWSRFTRNAAGALAMTLAMTGGLSLNYMPVLAATMGTVNVSALNVRSGPSTNNSRINTIGKGTKVEILSTEGGWYKVKIGSQEGYVSAQYVTVSGDNAGGSSVSSGAGTVNVSALNVRSGPSTSSQSFGCVSHGTPVTIISSENGWYKVNVKVNGKTREGYVFAEYITAGSGSGGGQNNSSETPAEGTSGVCNVSALNIRKGAGTSTAVCGLLKKGNAVSVISKEGEWYKISATINGSKVTGYVFADYITVNGDVPSGGETPEDPSENNNSDGTEVVGKNGKCNVYALNIRSQASTASSVIGSIKQNAIVSILEKSGDWYKVKATVNGRTVTGYAYAEYLTLTDEGGSSETPDNNNSDTPAEGSAGTANVNSLNVRSKATTASSSYGTINTGTEVTILATEGQWYKVKTKVNGREVTGYVFATYIDVKSGNPNGSTGNNVVLPSGTYEEVDETVWATAGVNIRKGAGTNYAVVGSLSKNASIKRTGIGNNGWSRVDMGGITAYISSEYLTTANPSPTNATGEDVVAFAKQFEGNPYVWGGNDLNKGVDCSGFTQQVYLNFGITLNRVADAQRSNGRRVSYSEAKPGDLIFYGSGGYATHVAIYIGDGKIIHASSPTVGIIISNANYKTPMQVNRIIEW